MTTFSVILFKSEKTQKKYKNSFFKINISMNFNKINVDTIYKYIHWR